MAKKELTTVQKEKLLNATHNTIFYGKYAVPAVPVAIVTGVNWEEWFEKQGTTLPFGLATMLLALIMTLLSYSVITHNEEDNPLNKASPFFYIGAALGMFVVSFFLLSNILDQMAFMFLYVVFGVLSSGALDQFDRSYLKGLVKEYKELVESNDLDTHKRKINLKKEQRKQKAKEEAERMLKKERESATE